MVGTPLSSETEINEIFVSHYTRKRTAKKEGNHKNRPRNPGKTPPMFVLPAQGSSAYNNEWKGMRYSAIMTNHVLQNEK